MACTPCPSSWTTAISPSVNRRWSFTASEERTSHDRAKPESDCNRPGTAGGKITAQKGYAGGDRPRCHHRFHRRCQCVEPVERQQESSPGKRNDHAPRFAQCPTGKQFFDAAAGAGTTG